MSLSHQVAELIKAQSVNEVNGHCRAWLTMLTHVSSVPIDPRAVMMDTESERLESLGFNPYSLDCDSIK